MLNFNYKIHATFASYVVASRFNDHRGKYPEKIQTEGLYRPTENLNTAIPVEVDH